MAFTDHKISAFAHKITDLADQPNLPPDELKARFDSSPEELRQAVNAICDEGDTLSARIDSYRAQTFTGEIERDMLAPAVQEELSGKADETSVAERISAETTAREAADSAETAAREAGDAALNEAVAKKCEVVYGSYVGNGNASRSISLGRKPQAVIVFYDGYINNGSLIYGGAAFPGAPGLAISIGTTGFTATGNDSGSGVRLMANMSGWQYHYLAFFSAE